MTTWDEGNQLTYPLKYHDIGYKDGEDGDGSEEAKATGFHVESSQDIGLQIIDFPQRDEERTGG